MPMHRHLDDRRVHAWASAWPRRPRPGASPSSAASTAAGQPVGRQYAGVAARSAAPARQLQVDPGRRRSVRPARLGTSRHRRLGRHRNWAEHEPTRHAKDRSLRTSYGSHRLAPRVRAANNYRTEDSMTRELRMSTISNHPTPLDRARARLARPRQPRPAPGPPLRHARAAVPVRQARHVGLPRDRNPDVRRAVLRLRRLPPQPPRGLRVRPPVLDKPWAAINTIVLITSSLTMAWGVRVAQLGKQRGLDRLPDP